MGDNVISHEERSEIERALALAIQNSTRKFAPAMIAEALLRRKTIS